MSQEGFQNIDSYDKQDAHEKDNLVQNINHYESEITTKKCRQVDNLNSRRNLQQKKETQVVLVNQDFKLPSEDIDTSIGTEFFLELLQSNKSSTISKLKHHSAVKSGTLKLRELDQMSKMIRYQSNQKKHISSDKVINKNSLEQSQITSEDKTILRSTINQDVQSDNIISLSDKTISKKSDNQSNYQSQQQQQQYESIQSDESNQSYFNPNSTYQKDSLKFNLNSDQMISKDSKNQPKNNGLQEENILIISSSSDQSNLLSVTFVEQINKEYSSDIQNLHAQSEISSINKEEVDLKSVQKSNNFFQEQSVCVQVQIEKEISDSVTSKNQQSLSEPQNFSSIEQSNKEQQQSSSVDLQINHQDQKNMASIEITDAQQAEEKEFIENNYIKYIGENKDILQIDMQIITKEINQMLIKCKDIFDRQLSENHLEELRKQELITQTSQLAFYERQLEKDLDIPEQKILNHMVTQIKQMIHQKYDHAVKEENIIEENKDIIHQIKKKVKCTEKSYIQQIFVEVYKRKYKIKSYLTSGGQADILIGEYIDEKGENKDCIIRITSSDEESFYYIKEEYELVKSFKFTSNIIQYFDAIYLEEIQIGVFIVERCSCSLTDVIRSKRNNNQNFTELEICKITFDLIHGLIEMRAQNILHQDIKPDNILINQEGSYIYSDFGCSSKFEKGKAENKGLTMKYCAPEQLIQSYFFNYQADIFQVGRTLQQVIELYQKLGGVQTRFILKLNQIILTSMIQEIDVDRSECIDLLFQLCDLVIETNQKEFIDFYLQKINSLCQLDIFIDSKESIYYANTRLYFQQILIQLRLYTLEYPIQIYQKFNKGLLNQIFKKIRTDIDLINICKDAQQKDSMLEKVFQLCFDLLDTSQCYYSRNDYSTDQIIYLEMLEISKCLRHYNEKLYIICLKRINTYDLNNDDIANIQKEKNNTKYSVNYCSILGQINYQNKQFPKSLLYFFMVFNIYYQQALESQDKRLSTHQLKQIIFDFYFSLNNLSAVYLSQGYYSASINWCRTAINYIQACVGKKRIEMINYYQNLGQSYMNLNQKKKAIDMLERALQLHEELIGEEEIKSYAYMVAKSSIANIYFENKEFKSSLKEYLELVLIFKQNLYEKQNPKVYKLKIKAYLNLSRVYSELPNLQDNLQQSLINYDQALELLEQKFGVEKLKEKQLYYYIQNEIGMCYSQASVLDYKKAIHHCSIYYNWVKTSRREELKLKQVTLCLNVIANSYGNLKMIEESQFYYLELLQILIDFNDYYNPVFEICVTSLQNIYSYFGKDEEEFFIDYVVMTIKSAQNKKIVDQTTKDNVIFDINTACNNIQQINSVEIQLDLLNQSILVLEHHKLDETEVYITILNLIGNIKFTGAQYKEAKEIYEKSVKIMKNLYEYPNQYVQIVLRNIAMCYHTLLDQQTAIIYYIETLETMKDLNYQSNKEQHPNLIECIDRILMCFDKYGNTVLSLEFYEKFEHIIQIVYDNSSPYYLKFIYQFGKCYYSMEQFEMALAYLEEYIQIWKSKEQYPDTKYIDCLFYVCDCNKKINNFQEAIDLNKQYSLIVQQMYGQESTYFIDSQLDIGFCYQKLEQYQNELKTYQELIKILENNSLQCDRIYQAMIVCYKNLGDIEMEKAYSIKFNSLQQS